MLKHREEERNESVLFGSEKSCIKGSQTAGLEGNHCGTQQQRCCGQFISFTCLHNLYIHDTQSFLYCWLRERYYRKSNCSIGCETIVIIQIRSGLFKRKKKSASRVKDVSKTSASNRSRLRDWNCADRFCLNPIIKWRRGFTY